MIKGVLKLMNQVGSRSPSPLRGRAGGAQVLPVRPAAWGGCLQQWCCWLSNLSCQSWMAAWSSQFSDFGFLNKLFLEWDWRSDDLLKLQCSNTRRQN